MHTTLEDAIEGKSMLELELDEHDTFGIRSEATRLRLSVDKISPHYLRDILPESINQLDESARAIERTLAKIEGEMASSTEYTKRRKLVPTVFICTDLVSEITKADGHLDGMATERRDNTNQRLHVQVREEFLQYLGIMEPSLGLLPRTAGTLSPSRYEITWKPSSGALCYDSLVHSRVRALHSKIEMIKSVLRIDIWIKQPQRTTAESLIRACQCEQSDFEDFLIWFRRDVLGISDTRIDCYIAQVLLGMRVSRGEILLSGDMKNLANLPDYKLNDAILRQARARKFADEREDQDRVPIDPPGSKKEGRRFDALTKTTFLSVIDRFYAPESPLEQGMMNAAFIEGLPREHLERIYRKVGLSRQHARFTMRAISGRAVLSDDPTRTRDIQQKCDDIFTAMQEDKVLKTLSGRFCNYFFPVFSRLEKPRRRARLFQRIE